MATRFGITPCKEAGKRMFMLYPLGHAHPAGKAEIVLAFSSNGLGRSLYQLVRVLRDFVAHKVALIIPAGGIDTSKVPGKVVLDTLD